MGREDVHKFLRSRAVLFCLERRPSRPRRSLGDLIKSCFALFEATDKLQGPVALSMVSVNQRLIPSQRIGFDTA